MKYLKLITILTLFSFIFVLKVSSEDVTVTMQIYDQLSLNYNSGRSSCSNGSINISGINFGNVNADNPVLCKLAVDVSSLGSSPYTLSMSVNRKLMDISSDSLEWFNNNTSFVVLPSNPVGWTSDMHPDGTSANINTGWVGYSLAGTHVPSQFNNGSSYAGFIEGSSSMISNNSSLNGTDQIDINTKIEVNPFQPTGNYSGMRITLTLLPSF